ncbi:MAG: sulfatase, partial [Ahrensia sp.]
ELQPDRPFVVLEFGDHQTLAARTLADEQHGGNSLADPDSSAYVTHYTLHSHNFKMEHKYFNRRQLDIGFLGVSFMQAIGVPLSPMYQDLADLRDQCGGRYSDCEDRQSVDKHLKRRINSGMLSLPAI